jgi:hypothetical protein
MKLFCDLFGHWPGLPSLRRHEGHWTCRCWLCESRLTRVKDEWQVAAR